MAASLLAHIHRLIAPTAGELGSDAELLRRFVDRSDQSAFAVLVARHGPMVWRLCRRVLGDVHAAEDACQAAFLVLARKANQIRHPEFLAAWLHGVGYRLALKTRAAEDRRRQIETQSRHVAPSSTPADPLAEVSARELLAILDAELQRLPEKYRLPLILCCLEGRSQPETARLLGWTEGSVKGRLERGREKLHQRLLRRGVTLPAALLALEATRDAVSARLPALLSAAILRAASTPDAIGGISTAVLALAEEGMRGLVAGKLKLMSILVLMVGIAAGGFGSFAYPRLAARRETETQTEEPKPPAQASVLPRTPAEQPLSRTDLYGDPLPHGAVARLGTVRFRHPFWVSGLAFTPDGKTLASACWDGSVRFWDAATGKQTRCLRCPQENRPDRSPIALLDLALSPDGKTLVAVGNQDMACVWDQATGKELHLLKGGNGFCLALSPDGKTFAVGDGEGRIRLWDVTTGKQIGAFGAKMGPVQALAFSPDAKVLAAGDSLRVAAAQGEEGVSTVRLWDAATGRQLRELKGHTGRVTTLAFSRDGRSLVSAGNDATLRFWDPAGGKQVRKIQVPDDTILEEDPDQHKGIDYGGIRRVAFSPDGRLLASGSNDGFVRIWDARSGKELHALRGHGREVGSVVFSPDGKVLASGGFDHIIHLWDVSSGKQLQPRQGHDGPVHNLAVSPDGRIAASVCHDHTIRLWDLATQQQRHILRGHTDFVYAVAYSPDSRLVASGSADGTIRIWDAATGRQTRLLAKHQIAVYSLVFTATGNVLIAGERDGTLRFWNVTTGEELRRIPQVYSSLLQLSADGNILATATQNAVHLLDVTTGKELRRFRGRSAWFALSPDGRTLAMQASEQPFRFWNTATGEEIGVFADWKWSPIFVGIDPYVFSPDGRLLARIGDDGDIELWELLTRKLRRSLRGHQARIGPFAFSPDGKTLLSGSEDTTVLIWDVARRHESRPARLRESQLQGLWRDLGGDAEKADQAIGTLAATAEQSLPFLQRHLHPARIAEEGRLQQLIADLDSGQFTVRAQAEQELERMGWQAETALRQALTKSPTLEARRRMEGLLAQLRGKFLPPDLLRVLRAAETLERVGTPEARRLLESLAEGASEARLTLEAKASLHRLAKRRSSPP